MDHVLRDLGKLLAFDASLPENERRKPWHRSRRKAAKQMLKIGRAALGE
jgi:hypothetical protein